MSDPGVWAAPAVGPAHHPATRRGGHRALGRPLGARRARATGRPGCARTCPAGGRDVVGTGGCALRVGTTWWNLYYRLTPPAWGWASAAELVTAAIDAAHAVDPDRPVIAYLLEHNAESRGRAEQAGLTLVWRGPDAGNPDPAAVRLVYADRRSPASCSIGSRRAPDQAPGTVKRPRIAEPGAEVGGGRPPPGRRPRRRSETA